MVSKTKTWLKIHGFYINSSISKVKTQWTILEYENNYFKFIQFQIQHQKPQISLVDFSWSESFL